MAALALDRPLVCRPQCVDSVASRTIGRPRFRSRQHQLAVFARRVLVLLLPVASAAKHRHVIGWGDPIGWSRAVRSPMLLARPVADGASQFVLSMLVSLEIRDLFGMASTAKVGLGLCGQSRQEQEKRDHTRLTSLRSIDSKLAFPASAIASLSSAPSIQSTRSTPFCP